MSKQIGFLNDHRSKNTDPLHTTKKYNEKIRDFVLQPSVVFTPRSFFHDRFQAGPDVIQMPHRVKPGGVISVIDNGITAISSPNARSGLRFLKDRLQRNMRSEPAEIRQGYVVDLRTNSPQNWSHLLNFHIPLLAFVETKLGLSLSEITAVFPYNMPPYAKSALATLGVRSSFTDGIVTGHHLAIHLSHENVHRTDARLWFLNSEMRKAKIQSEKNISVPKRIFIGRRGSRGLVNQDQFEKLLEPLGFSTIYPERMPVKEQFALFSKSEIVVAVHGAALGPLLLREDSSHSPPAIVGIMPSGVVSDFFRMMSQQVGSRWVGIRGKIRSEYVQPAYDLKQGSLTGFESHDVEIDKDTLLMAIDHALNSTDHRLTPT